MARDTVAIETFAALAIVRMSIRSGTLPSGFDDRVVFLFATRCPWGMRLQHNLDDRGIRYPKSYLTLGHIHSSQTSLRAPGQSPE